MGTKVVKVTSSCPYAYTSIRYASTHLPGLFFGHGARTVWGYYYLDDLQLAHNSHDVRPADAAKYALGLLELFIHTVINEAKGP